MTHMARLGNFVAPGHLWLTATMRRPFNRFIDLSAGIVDGSTVHAALPLSVGPVPEGMDPQPFLTLQFETAQSLMDQLWNCGLRPTEGSGSAGAFAAQARHLEDMRALVFRREGP